MFALAENAEKAANGEKLSTFYATICKALQNDPNVICWIMLSVKQSNEWLN